MRGVAVLVILLFHSEYGWIEGGYLSISMFFSLSGFLIGSLLLREHALGGRIDLFAFYKRRLMRLLPASLVTLGAVLVVDAAINGGTTLTGDVLAALAYVANWRFVAEDRSYIELFIEPSPVQHFWSLSLEEQFYLAFPVLLVATLGSASFVARRRGGRSRLDGRYWVVAVFGALAIGSQALMWRISDIDRSYYGTDTRAFELLAGVLLAAWYVRGDGGVRAAPRWAPVAGMFGAAGLVAGFVVVDQPRLWSWFDGFWPFALCSVAVISGCLVEESAFARALAWRPLRITGMISYGLYLYHWPLFVWLSDDRLGLEGLAATAIRFVATFAAAGASWVLVERQVQRRLRWPSRRVVTLGLGVTASALLLVWGVGRNWGVTSDREETAEALEEILAPVDDPASDPGVTSTVPPTTAPEDPAGTTAPPTTALPSERWLVLGDSTGRGLANGIADLAPDGVELFDRSTLGCGIGPGAVADECEDWSVRWPAMIEEVRPDRVIVHMGVTEQYIDTPGEDPPWDSAEGTELRNAQIGRVMDVAGAGGIPVVWTLPPDTPDADFFCTTGGSPENCDVEFTEAFRSSVRAAAATRPWVLLADLQAWTSTRPASDRVDGLHFSKAANVELADWLVGIVREFG